MNFTSTFILILLLNFVGNFNRCSTKKDLNSESSKVLEEDCISYQFAPITKVKEFIPEQENDDYYFEITFLVKNGCGGFGNFIIETNQDSLNISVNAKYTGCACTLAMQDITTFYQYKDEGNISIINFIGDNENFEIKIN